MSVPLLFTYSDAVDALVDFARGFGKGASIPTVARAVRGAYREIVASHNWSFLESVCRVQLEAPYTTGTIQYTSSTKIVTLSGGTFPANAEDMRIRFDDVVSHVESRDSDTQLTLDATMCPNANVAAGESFSIYPRWYVLPPDFVAMSDPLDESEGWRLGLYITPAEMHSRERFVANTGSIRYYTVGPAPGLYGSMALFIDPPSDEAETMDIPYKRRPRDIKYTGYLADDNSGTISTTADSDSVTGSGTAFEAGHVGALLRRGESSIRPTGLDGEAPYQEQRTITAVGGTTSLTLDAGAAATASTVKYMITDPIDLDVVAYDAFLRRAEAKLARALGFKDRREIEQEAKDALFSAKCADSRLKDNRVAGQANVQVVRMTDYKTRTAVP